MKRATASQGTRRPSGLRLAASAAIGLTLGGCSDGPELRRLQDATVVRDAGEAGVIGPRDGSADSSGDAAPTDGSSADAGADADAGAGADADAGPTSSACSVSDPFVLASVPSTESFAPVVASTDGTAVVAWIESRLGVTDVHARRIAASGDADPEIPLTDDFDVENGLALVATDDGYVVAFGHALLGGTDMRALGFDASTGEILGTLEVTTDIEDDRAPMLMPAASGPVLAWERTIVQAGVYRQGLTSTGTARDTPAEVSATRAWAAPHALDATASDVRLYHRLDSSTLESIALDADGLELDPGATPQSFDFSGYAVGTRLRTTPANGTPRALLVDATEGASATALLQRVNGSGAPVGTPIEVAVADSALMPAVTTYGGRTVVVYRTDGAAAPELRLRAYRATGTRSADLALGNLDAVTGSLELITSADGSAMILVYDDVPDGTSVRELRVVFVTCALP